MGLFLVWRHRLICILSSLCKHACKEVCDVKQGVDPCPLLPRSCDRWWPDFVNFTACKRSIFGLKRGKKAQCVSNRCKDLFKRKKYFGVMGTLNVIIQPPSAASEQVFHNLKGYWANTTLLKQFNWSIPSASI